MTGGRLVIGLCAALLTAGLGAPATADAGPVREGEHFRVTCHGSTGEVADASLAAAEAAWSVVDSMFPGVTPAPHARLLDIQGYERFSEFAAADAQFGGGQFAKDCLNFTLWDTLTSYVILGNQCREEVVRRAGVPWDIRRWVAHEAAHLATAERFGYAWGRAEWLCEGLATYVEGQALAKLGSTTAASADPNASTRMANCRKMLAAGRLPEPRAIFEGTFDRSSVPERYAVYWAFFEFLMEPGQRARTMSALTKVRTLRDGPDATQRVFARVREVWGDKGLDALADGFRKHVDGFTAEWDISWGRLTLSGSRWVQSSMRGMGGTWRTQAAGKAAYCVAGTLEMHSFGRDDHVFVMLGRTKEGLIAVDIAPGGGVAVYEGRTGKTPEDMSWRGLARASSARVAAGAKTPFEISVDGESLSVKLAGKDVLESPVAGHDMTGAWGLGVGPDAAVIWEDVVLR